MSGAKQELFGNMQTARGLRRYRRRRRSTPEKRRVHECKVDGGAVVALYDDGTWGYLWRPDEVSYEEDL